MEFVGPRAHRRVGARDALDLPQTLRDLGREVRQLLVVVAGEHDSGGAAAEQFLGAPASASAAATASRPFSLARIQELDTGAASGRPQESTHERRCQILGPLVFVHEVDGERSAFFPDHALDAVYTFHLLDRFETFEGANRGLEAPAALRQANGELDLVGDRRLARTARGDEEQGGDDAQDDGGDDSGDPARRPAQRGCEHAREQDPGGVRRRLAAEALATLTQLAQPADRRGCGEMPRQQGHQADCHQQ